MSISRIEPEPTVRGRDRRPAAGLPTTGFPTTGVPGARVLMVARIGIGIAIATQVAMAPGVAQEQPDPTLIVLVSRQFRPPPGIEPALQDSLIANPNQRYHAIVQFAEITSHQEYAQAHLDLGIQILEFIPNQAWLASLDSRVVDADLGAVEIRSIVRLLPEDRIDPDLLAGGPHEHAVDDAGNLLLSVTFFEDVADSEADAILAGHSAQVTDGPLMLHDWEIALPPANLPDLLHEDAVAWIDEIAPTPVETADGLTTNMRAYLAWARPFVVKGDGVKVGLFEALGHPDNNRVGGIRPGHDDFYGENAELPIRINVVDSPGVAFHATAVAGVLMGTGYSSHRYGNRGRENQWRGVAPAATLYCSARKANITPDKQKGVIDTHRIDMSNNSWGYDALTDFSNRVKYTTASRKFDWIVTGRHAHPVPAPIPVIFSAGNEGWMRAWRTVAKGGPSAKNTITVGSIYSDTNDVTPGSSRGPVQDGRVKPDCVAPGDERHGDRIKTAKTRDTYKSRGGTSIAAPAVTGAAALLLAHWRKTADPEGPDLDPLPSTIKALLLGGAHDLGNPGPDFKYGYGAVDVLESIQCLTDRRLTEGDVATGEWDSYDIPVPASAETLLVTLVWDDPRATAAAGRRLVNNLDLTVVEPPDYANTHRPWILDPSAGNENNNATTGVDNLNNVEQVQVASPRAGIWKAFVTGTAVTRDSPQSYSICFRVISTRPSIECVSVDFDPEASCCTFEWTITNNSKERPLTGFYLDLEAGTGAQDCNDLAHISLDGFTPEFCYPWDSNPTSNRAVVRFTGGSIAPEASKTGTLEIDVNGAEAVNVEHPGWEPLVIPPYSIHCHVTELTPAYLDRDCDGVESDAFGPHVTGQIYNWSWEGEHNWTWVGPCGIPPCEEVVCNPDAGDLCETAITIPEDPPTATFYDDTCCMSDAYDCPDVGASGPDKVYRLSLEAGCEIRVCYGPCTPGDQWDGAVYLLRGPTCDGPFECVASADDAGPGEGPEEFVYVADEPGDYYLIADGRDGACGTYGLVVERTNDCRPTPVQLTSFEIASGDGGVIITWRPSSSENLAGYNILRAEEGGDPGHRINEELIRSTDDGTREYEFVDASAVLGRTYDYRLEAVDRSGGRELSEPKRVTVGAALPAQPVLHAARPNPFNPTTTIGFDLPAVARVKLTIYDATGRAVRELVDGNLAPGHHAAVWDGRNDGGQPLPSGVYLYRLEVGGRGLSKKLVLMK